MSPVLRSTKRKRSSTEDSAPESSPTRPPPTARPVKRKRSIGKGRQDSFRPGVTARSLQEIPCESGTERVHRWKGRDTARLQNMSSSASGSNPRKRSRKSSSTTASVSSLPTSMSSERTSTYDRLAPDVFMDNNIYGPSYCVDPANRAALQATLERNRRSLSPTLYPDSNFPRFVQANHKALNEGQLVSEVVHPYFTSYFDHVRSTDLAFTHMEPIIRPPARMPPPKPDHSFGIAKEDIRPEVRHALDRYIVCAPGSHTPAAVNDMMQVKGRDGKASVLESQITLDGAFGERAMHELHSYARGSALPADGVAHAFVQSYHAGTMKFHAVHRQPSATPSGPDRIYTTEIAGQYLCGSPAQFRDGLKKYRNSVEYAAECRRQAVEAANSRAIQATLESEPGGDEDSDEFYDVVD